MSRRLLALPLAVLALPLAFLALARPAPASAASDSVVISEFRFRGPAGGNDEFVELRNVSAAPVDISGWTLDGCSSAGSTGARATIGAGVTLPPGKSYLLTNAGPGGYSGTVIGDQTYSTGIADTGGVRLLNGAAVVDAAGSSASPCREGAGLTLPTTNADTSCERAGGTRDTDDNAADFASRTADPQNLSGKTLPAPVITPIHDVQGAGDRSPLVGRTVTIEGVVSGVDDEIGQSFTQTFPEDAGIFVQERTPDADPATSEGIFVGLVRNRRAFPPGTVVRLNGKVVERFGETRIVETAGEQPLTLATAPVPAPVQIDPVKAAAQTAVARGYYESLEGMNVLLPVGTANSGGRNDFGETFLTPGTARDRVFRDEPQPDLIAADSDAGAGDPDEPLMDNSSTTALPVDLFDTVRNLEGPLAFGFSNYRIVNQERDAPLIEKGPTPYPYSLPAARDDQLRLASFNVGNFFPAGLENDGHIVSRAEYAVKRDRIVDAIGRLLKRPDVVAVMEVVDLASLRDVADHLGGYTAYLEPGNDARGIDVGFLIKNTVTATGVRQLGKDAPGSCSDVPGRLFDRPPLAVDIAARGVRFTVLANHFAARLAPDSCRTAQAAFVRDQVRAIEAGGGSAIVAGDLNAFEDESALATLQDGRTTLRNQWSEAPARERYSFAFQGRLETLDHVLLTHRLERRVLDVRYAHFNTDYYERPGPRDGHKVSDHDAPVLTLDLPGPPVNEHAPIIRSHERHGRVGHGDVLVADPGKWSVDEGPITFSYAWERSAGAGWAAAGTQQAYHLTKADRGARLRLVVTAKSPGGMATAVSAPTVPVRY